MARLNWMIPSVLVFCVVMVAAGDHPEWTTITGPPEFVFPSDHGAHPDARTEWWYLTGIVSDSAGRRFGFQFTFFRQGLVPGPPAEGESALRARQIGAAHLAVTDVDGQRFLHAERLRRQSGGLAGWSSDDLEVWIDDWSLRRTPEGVLVLQARDVATAIGVEVELRPGKPLVRQGDRGYSQKGADPGNASAYLSWTRLEVVGNLEVDGRPRTIEGAAWFDHEWGSSQLGAGVAGWDWFSLRLEDGRELMVYRLRLNDGSQDRFSSGTVVSADGSSIRLTGSDFTIEPLAWWTSPDSGGRYPVRWRLRVPAHDVELAVDALLEVCELDGSASTGVVYWEGPVAGDGSVRGEGYAELTGYADTLEGRF